MAKEGHCAKCGARTPALHHKKIANGVYMHEWDPYRSSFHGKLTGKHRLKDGGKNA